MKRLNLNMIFLSCTLLIMLLPYVSHAGDSWVEFVMPQPNKLTSGATFEQDKWGKSTWRSGSTFKFNDESMAIKLSPHIADAKKYRHTEPQRRSVNPWSVNHFQGGRQYKFGPSLRPWGNVPVIYHNKPFNGQINHAAILNQNYSAPVSVFNPYINKGFGGASNLLLPVSNFSPFNNAMMYRNNLRFVQPYGFHNAYFRR